MVNNNQYINLYMRLKRELQIVQRDADALSRELGIPSVDLADSVARYRLSRLR